MNGLLRITVIRIIRTVPIITTITIMVVLVMRQLVRRFLGVSATGPSF